MFSVTRSLGKAIQVGAQRTRAFGTKQFEGLKELKSIETAQSAKNAAICHKRKVDSISNASPQTKESAMLAVKHTSSAFYPCRKELLRVPFSILGSPKVTMHILRRHFVA
jgi:hypothetical protein